MRYSVWEGNMDKLMKKATRIQNKCRKYGCDFRFEEVGEEFKEIGEAGNTYMARFVIIEAEGVAVINDWQYIGSLEHTQHGNIINRVVEVEVPERYYTTAPICEHCKTNHIRKNTYIVMNTKTGEFKQVGKSCLRDFTGGMDIGFAASLAEFIETVEEAEKPMFGYHQEFYYNTREFLLFAVETIRVYGYAPTSEENSTISRIHDIIRHVTGNYNKCDRYSVKRHREIMEELETKGFKHDSDDNKATVEAAINWVLGQTTESNYIHNVQTVVKNDACKWKNSGILASLIPTYYKAIEREMKIAEQKAQEAKSEWQGEIGKRIKVTIVEWRCVTSWETQWGVTGIYKMVDRAGNIYTWKTSNGIYSDAHEVEITGTVKAHNEFRGAKQTELTRCKVKHIIYEAICGKKTADKYRDNTLEYEVR